MAQAALIKMKTEVPYLVTGGQMISWDKPQWVSEGGGKESRQSVREMFFESQRELYELKKYIQVTVYDSDA